MDIVDELRKDPYEEERQYKGEARLELGGILDKAADEIERLREALRSLIQLNDNYSFFGGELYQDRIEKTWDKARTALKEKEVARAALYDEGPRLDDRGDNLDGN